VRDSVPIRTFNDWGNPPPGFSEIDNRGGLVFSSATTPRHLFARITSNAVGFMAGQAGFTLFAVVLFCILTPLQKQVGVLRVEDIALGGAIGLLVCSLQRLGDHFKERVHSRSARA
jgi:hypothetical protein